MRILLSESRNILRKYIVSRRNWLIIFFLCTMGVSAVFGSGNTGDSEDVGTILMHHVVDGHEWKPIPFLPAIKISDIKIGPVTIPFTRHVVMLLINAVLLCVIFIGAFHKRKTVPSGLASALEPVVFMVRDMMVYPAMGEELGKKWLFYFNTVFFFIIGANLLGIIPVFATSTGNINVAAALAIITFIQVLYMGIRKNGFLGYFKNMIPEGLPLPLGIFMLCIEIPLLVVRNAVLAIRLFANMIAGHFIIASLLLLIFLLHPLASILAIPMAIFIDLMELLIAFIQAMVFTMLSAIFIKMSLTHE